MHNSGKKRRACDRFLNNKRGLSEVVTNLLIILLVLVSVGVIWVVVRNIISQGAGEIELGQFTFDLSIESAYVNGSDIVVSVRRSAGGGADFLGMSFIFVNESESISIEKPGFLQESGRRTFVFSSSEIPGIGAGDDVSVAPVYTSSGEEKTGDTTDTATISGTPPPGSGGNGNGNGNGGGEPECNDETDNDGDGNTDLSDAGCTDSSDTDETNCGDGVCEGGENVNICSLDCLGDAPASCDGVWNQTDIDGGNECDGGGVPGGVPNCQANCICEPGFGSGGSGSCVLDSPINSGTIFSVWPTGAAKYFDSEDLPVNVDGWTFYYVNFTSPTENGCFRITFAEYLELNGRSYLRTEFVVNVSSGQQYSVWAAANCGQ